MDVQVESSFQRFAHFFFVACSSFWLPQREAGKQQLQNSIDAVTVKIPTPLVVAQPSVTIQMQPVSQ